VYLQQPILISNTQRQPVHNTAVDLVHQVRGRESLNVSSFHAVHGAPAVPVHPPVAPLSNRTRTLQTQRPSVYPTYVAYPWAPLLAQSFVPLAAQGMQNLAYAQNVQYVMQHMQGIPYGVSGIFPVQYTQVTQHAPTGTLNQAPALVQQTVAQHLATKLPAPVKYYYLPNRP